MREGKVRGRKWALEQIEKEYEGFHPLIEMVRIAQKPAYTSRDKVRFGYLVDIAKFMVPKPRPLEILTDDDGNPLGSGKMTIEWKS